MKHFNLTLKQFVIVNVLLLCGALYGYSTENPISIKKENLPFKTGSDIDIQTISEITPSEAYRYLKNNNYQWIDYRPETEVKSFGKISNAVWYYYSSPDFTNRISRLNRNGNYIIFGSTGNANSQVLSAFRKLGFRNVRAIKGGFVEWKRQNYPILTSENGSSKPSFPPSGIYSLEASEAIKYVNSSQVIWLDLRKHKLPNIDFITNLNSEIQSSSNFLIRAQVDRLDKTKHYIFFTDKGSRNSSIRKIFKDKRFKNVKSVGGGYRDLNSYFHKEHK